MLAHMLRQLKALGKCLCANGAAERQGKQRLVISLNRLLGIGVANIAIHIIHEFGIFSHSTSFTFIFRQNFVWNQTTAAESLQNLKEEEKKKKKFI